MPTINSASRRISKATYVPLRIDQRVPREKGAAVLKFGFLRNLQLQPGEVEALRDTLDRSKSHTPITGDLSNLARSFEGAPLPSQLPPISALSDIPTSALTAFGEAIVALRKQAATKASPPPAGALMMAVRNRTPGADAPALYLLNAATVALRGFATNIAYTPVGMLNLERLEMTPAGIERGELLATIPLAPREKTAVVQKEWSVTSREFTSIVTDSLESYSETGVTENTELAQSTTSQVQHSNQFNINATVSGGIGFVTGSVATSFGAQDSSSRSATDSTKHAVETTRKASSRVKQEHKTTITTTTVTGTSETTTRMLENPSDTDPIRIDYFSLMRKWRVRLYRYGLRMTYDIGIPEPGAAMRKTFEELATLQDKASQVFVFDLKVEDITPDKLPALVDRYGASLPEPPAPGPTLTPGGQVPGLDDSEQWHFFQLAFNVPDGYWVTNVSVNAKVGIGDDYGAHAFGVQGTPFWDHSPQADYNLDLTGMYGFMLHYTGSQSVSFFFQWANVAWVGLTVRTEPTPAAMQQWQLAVWTACYNAAQTAFYANQQAINSQIQALQDKIAGVDTLTLRREESDEIMKGVLRWLLGTGFDFMPPSVQGLFAAAGGDLKYGVTFTGNDLGISPQGWTTMFQYQEVVKFINEAIEWENVSYFLYSYFWDVPPSWDFIRQIRHPDSTRQAFLRSGSARVVLTVRKGWEEAWTSFVESGSLGGLPGNHPYMTIAQEIQAYDDTNYPGIPPANPGGPAFDQQDAVSTTCSDAVAAGEQSLTVESTKGFVVGAKLVIDSFDSGVQESQVITAVPDATHVTVKGLKNAHDGTSIPFPVIQPGEAGVIIAEWNEYTPSSGTDIAVTSNLATIA